MELPDANDIKEYTEADPSLTLAELNSLWPMLSIRCGPWMDWELHHLVSAYRLGREHGMVESQAQNVNVKTDTETQ